MPMGMKDLASAAKRKSSVVDHPSETLKGQAEVAAKRSKDTLYDVPDPKPFSGKVLSTVKTAPIVKVENSSVFPDTTFGNNPAKTDYGQSVSKSAAKYKIKGNDQ